MDEVKGKVKGFMKKVNNPFSSSSSFSSAKFEGQGRVLGSSSSPNSPPPVRSINNPPQSTPNSTSDRTCQVQPQPKSPPTPPPSSQPNNHAFDPFGSFITSGKRTAHGCSLNAFECPICGASFGSEEAVSVHVETCLSTAHQPGSDLGEDRNVQAIPGSSGELEARVGAFLSGNPPEGSVEVVLKLLRNIVREPDNVRFRRVRMSNPKIREAVGEVVGCVELLEHVGFQLREDDGEMWAVMEAPAEEGIVLINKAVSLLEPPPPPVEDVPCAAASALPEGPIKPKKVDRQIRVFFSVPESVAAKIHLPDSFYNLSLGELKREANLRKKMIADSQLLIPRSYKEKQAKSARMKYKKTLIRVQFPDGVVLQGVFSPYESTSALYEFVCSALKQPALEFDLLDPVLVKRRVIPRLPLAEKKKSTLEEEGLVPSALIRFKPFETDSVVFTGLRNELLEISEPLVNETAVSPL